MQSVFNTTPGVVHAQYAVAVATNTTDVCIDLGGMLGEPRRGVSLAQPGGQGRFPRDES